MNIIRKSAVLFLTVALILGCAGCAGKDEGAATATVSQTQAAATQVTASHAEYGGGTRYNKSWNASLPVGFPEKPEGVKVVSTKVMPYEAYKSDYSCEYLRITMRCMEHHMGIFANGMADNGYIGGYVFYREGGSYEEGLAAHWSNGEYFVTSSSSEYSEKTQDNLSYTVTLDVVKCENKVPEAIGEYSPVFDGYTAKSGKYTGYDMVGTESSVFRGFSADVYWMWEFTGNNAIYGVTPGMLNAYTQQLKNAGFKVPGDSENDGYGEVYSFAAEALDSAGNIYCVYMRYFAYLDTLEIVYCNNHDYFFGISS